MFKLTEAVFRFYFCVLAFLFMLFGVVFSKVMLSMGVIGLALNAVFDKNIAQTWLRFKSSPVLLLLTGVFFLYAVSGLWSENLDWLSNRLRMKLPFLLLPFSIVAVPAFNLRVQQLLLYFFFGLITLVCLYLFGWYVLHFEAVTQSYKLGQVIPTPCRHIHFSLMTAFSALIGWDFWRQGFHWRYPRVERFLQVGASLFLVFFLHILAVRSGIVAFYLAVLAVIFWYVVVNRRLVLGLVAVFALAGAAFLALKYVPTLKNKVDYTLYNVYLIKRHENLRDLSDSYRVATIHAGLEMVKTHPWTGVGIGDVRDATDLYLQEHYPDLAGAGYMPQSQYVLVAAALGWPGLVFFLCCTLFPLAYRRAYRQPLLLAFFVIALSAFVVEQLLETQAGTAFYLVFLLTFVRQNMETEL